MAAVSMMSYPPRDMFQGYPQQYAMYDSRTHQRENGTARPSHTNPYASYTSVPQQHHSTQTRTPQPNQSPIPDDGLRPSLPSISNLLGIANGDRSLQESVAQQQTQVQAPSEQYPQPDAHPASHEQRPQPTNISHDLSSNQRTVVPPTPPFRNDSVVDGTHSPSTISTGSSLSAGQPYYLGSALNNVEAADQRAVAAHLIKRHSLPSQPNTSPYGNVSFTNSPFAQSPGAPSSASYYSPNDMPQSGLYAQRSLPSNFPPPPPMLPPQDSKAQWEHHHHYISQTSSASFQQSQDRYICPTCNKAFSRPSSLKIHSHSHTGEKPFKCPHSGCGKAFSVRSNMKRHERGCHGGSGEPGSA